MATSAPPVQPPFDQRIRSMPSMSSTYAANKGGIGGDGGAAPYWSSLPQPTRGYMAQDSNLPGFKGAGVFNFQYNPSTVESVYQIQSGGAAAAMLFPNALNEANLAVPLNQSASWTLLFDRTYELWDAAGYKAQGNSNLSVAQDPTLQGVYADVAQLMWFTGMDLTLAAAGIGGGTVQTVGGGNAGSNNGIMMMVPCWVYFGGYDVNTKSYSPIGIGYYGFISEWDVTYTHWQNAMVPMRCAIDITFNLLPPSESAASSQNAGVLSINTNKGYFGNGD